MNFLIYFSDNTGKEVVTRYHLYGMNTNGTFYTDSNGREMLKRERNRRPSYNFSLEEPVAGNYYPVTTRISIKDENLRLSVLTDRAEGGTSLHDGEVEMMVSNKALPPNCLLLATIFSLTMSAQLLVLWQKGSQAIIFSH